MGFFSGIWGAAVEANEEAHGARLRREFDDTAAKMGNMSGGQVAEVCRRFSDKRDKLLQNMGNWTAEGRLKMAVTLRDAARKRLDFNVVESYALWMASAWLEAGERRSANAAYVHRELERLLSLILNASQRDQALNSWSHEADQDDDDDEVGTDERARDQGSALTDLLEATTSPSLPAWISDRLGFAIHETISDVYGVEMSRPRNIADQLRRGGAHIAHFCVAAAFGFAMQAAARADEMFGPASERAIKQLLPYGFDADFLATAWREAIAAVNRDATSLEALVQIAAFNAFDDFLNSSEDILATGDVSNAIRNAARRRGA